MDLLEVRRERDVAVVAPKVRRLDASVAPAFRQAVLQLVEGGDTRVVLDLARLEFLDSSGLGAMVSILKALGTGWRRGISWRDMEIRNEPGGRPIVALRGGARDVVEQLGITEMLISISHCRSHATAYALAQGNGPKQDE